jgi:hypothetical protein
MSLHGLDEDRQSVTPTTAQTKGAGCLKRSSTSQSLEWTRRRTAIYSQPWRSTMIDLWMARDVSCTKSNLSTHAAMNLTTKCRTIVQLTKAVAHSEVVSVERVIVAVRGRRVILDSDLAKIYGVEPRTLNQAVKRNRGRFPSDFAFRLTRKDAIQIRRSRSQSVILKRGKNIKYLPLAFTEHGAIMVASVLNSSRAVDMSIFVVRAFLRLREWIAGRSELAARLGELERRVGAHDHDLKAIIAAIRDLIVSPAPARRRIGFDAGKGLGVRRAEAGHQ